MCFHCQQCIEKYLKAFLIYNESEPPRTHDRPRRIFYSFLNNDEFISTC
ncbi:MAG: HEPN domain-containing protein [Nitrospirae bacterium]|nr:HEPN domain-containing protein [Nitrospirota bacterium]